MHPQRAEPPESFRPTVLVTIDDAFRSASWRTARSLDLQTWKHVRRVEKVELREIARNDTREEPYLWLHLTAGDVIAPAALERMVEPFTSQKVAIVYTDEDNVGLTGRHHRPMFKPAWSPLLAESGWLSLEGSLLRLSAIPDHIDLECNDVAAAALAVAAKNPQAVKHLPQVLLSRWRAPKRVRQVTKAPLAALPTRSISVVVPIRDRPDLLKACMEGLQERTEGVELDIVIVDNDSVEPETVELLQSYARNGSARAINMPGAFNFSRACNLGVNAGLNESILLLNNDVYPINADWLVQMQAEMADASVGAVGAYLLYPDGFVQHAGVTIGAGSIARHSFSFIHPNSGEDRGLLRERRDVSAVTGACLLTRKSLWKSVGGMDQDNLSVAFNDVDYCLKIRQLEKRVIWTPFAKLWHRESVSRGKDDTAEKMERFAREEAVMYRRWKNLLENDPFHSPNLSKIGEDFTLGVSRLPHAR